MPPLLNWLPWADEPLLTDSIFCRTALAGQHEPAKAVHWATQDTRRVGARRIRSDHLAARPPSGSTLDETPRFRFCVSRIQMLNT